MESESNNSEFRKRPPAKTPEAREKQLIALAVSRAEQQLRDGTASAMVITHYLKLASPKEKLERELLTANVDLAKAKTEEIQSHKRIEELQKEAMIAFGIYRGDDHADQDIQ